MKCEICGTVNRDDTAVCAVCGHRFFETDAQRPIQPPKNRLDNRRDITDNTQFSPSVTSQPSGYQPAYGAHQAVWEQQPVYGQPQNTTPAYGQPQPDPFYRQPQTPPAQYSGRITKSLAPLIIIASVLAALVIIASIVVFSLAHTLQKHKQVDSVDTGTLITVIQPAADETEDTDAQAYAAAEQLMENGSYREAADAFNALGNYMDSAELAAECLNYADYNDALNALDTGDAAEAAEIFARLGDFEDSAEQLAKCGLALPASAVDEMDEYFRDTLSSTFNGGDWQHDTLSEMKLLGRYELISKSGSTDDNRVYLLYQITGHNDTNGSLTYYWFGCYKDVTVSNGSISSYSDRSCFTNGAGNEYRLYINGSSLYYYYGYKTVSDFEEDRINDLLNDYSCVWIPAE